MAANEMGPRRRDKRGELLDEFKRPKDDVGGSVAPAALEAIQQPAAESQTTAPSNRKAPSFPDVTERLQLFNHSFIHYPAFFK